jgi:5'-nucleotidase
LACDGSPSDCVALALLGLLPQTIDLVVSGINPNANMGHDLTYSGTVTAALEASIWGVAGIAVSVDHPDGSNAPVDYTPAARAARQVIKRMVVPGQKPDFLLNVNVPWLPEDQIRGFRITRQGTRIYRDVLVRREDPRGRPYYWFGGDIPTGIAEDGTDFGALADGYVSITPLDLDLTNHDRLETLRPWGWNSKP